MIDLSKHKDLIRVISIQCQLPFDAVERVAEALLFNGWREPANHADIKFQNHRSPVYPTAQGANVRSLKDFKLGK